MGYAALIEGPDGQGRTSAALTIYAGLHLGGRLGDAGSKVGGFCARRVYSRRPGGKSEHIGYDAHLFSTDEVFPLARPRERPPREDPWPFQVEETAYHRAFDQAMKDLEDPQVKAFILDGLDPLWARPLRRSRMGRVRTGGTRRLEELVAAFLDAPTPVKVLFASLHKTAMVEIARTNMAAHRSRIVEQFPWRQLTYATFRTLPSDVVAEIGEYVGGERPF